MKNMDRIMGFLEAEVGNLKKGQANLEEAIRMGQEDINDKIDLLDGKIDSLMLWRAKLAGATVVLSVLASVAVTWLTN
jgi:hypothetical protein